MENNNQITYEQFMEMKRRFDEAENDDTPYAVVDEADNLKVIGDVNKTELKKYDYTVQFGYRNTPENKEALQGEKIIGETPNYIGVERKYHDAWIPPRKFTEVQATMIQLYKFFNIVTPDGGLRDLTADEALAALHTMNGDMIDAMCAVVGTVLNIPKKDWECMLLLSAIMACMQMAEDFPEVVNGADFTIGKLPEEK